MPCLFSLLEEMPRATGLSNLLSSEIWVIALNNSFFQDIKTSNHSCLNTGKKFYKMVGGGVGRGDEGKKRKPTHTVSGIKTVFAKS